MWISNLSPSSLRLLALALWLLSLALPTLHIADGGTVPGFSLFVSGWLWLPLLLVSLPASAVAVSSLLSNLLFLRVAWQIFRRQSESRATPRWAIAVGLAANIAVAVPWAGAPLQGVLLGSLHTLPGYYCWLLAFVMLGYATLQESPLSMQWLDGVLRRVGLMALVVAGVIALGFLAILLFRPA